MWFDATVVEWVVETIPLWFAFVMLFASYLGSVYVIGPATVFVYLRGKSWRTATWVGIVIGAYALFVFAKPLTDIPRPDVSSPLADESLPVVLSQLHHAAVDFDTESFPSGHAIAATVFYGLVVVDLNVSTRRKRLFVAASLLVFISLSRIALGVHYIEDVVGGAVLGLSFLGFVLFMRERVSNPAESMLAVAAVLALGSIVTGRPVDGVVLLSIIVVAFFAHRLLDVRGSRLTCPLKTVTNRSE